MGEQSMSKQSAFKQQTRKINNFFLLNAEDRERKKIIRKKLFNQSERLTFVIACLHEPTGRMKQNEIETMRWMFWKWLKYHHAKPRCILKSVIPENVRILLNARKKQIHVSTFNIRQADWVTWKGVNYGISDGCVGFSVLYFTLRMKNEKNSVGRKSEVKMVQKL